MWSIFEGSMTTCVNKGIAENFLQQRKLTMEATLKVSIPLGQGTLA